MCWRIDKKTFKKNPEKYHKIAEEDIVVYKFGLKIDGKFFPSYYSEFGYKPNSNNDKVSLKLIKKGGTCLGGHCVYIDEGYHSYSGECGIINSFYDIGVYSKNDNEKNLDFYWCEDIGKFIIPKGTEYYENEVGEIASSQLVWTGEYYLISKMEIGKTIQLKNL